jgi:hypothetical protein
MVGAINLNLSSGNFYFLSDVSASCADGLRNLLTWQTNMYGRMGGGGSQGAYIGRTIKSSTTISWDGSLIGSCNLLNTSQVWGCVRLVFIGFPITFEICLITYGTNSMLKIPSSSPYTQKIVPISWGSAINLWSLLQSQGIDPTNHSFLMDISMEFVNQTFSNLPTNPQSFTSTLVANITNIQIKE